MDFPPFAEGNEVKAVVVSGCALTRKQIDQICTDTEVQSGAKPYWFRMGAVLALPVQFLNASLLWISASFNYLFPVCLICVTMALYQRDAERGAVRPGTCVLALLCGATTEQSGAAAIVILGLWGLLNLIRKKIRFGSFILPLLLSCAGYASVILAPGTWVRVGHESGGGLLKCLEPEVFKLRFGLAMRYMLSKLGINVLYHTVVGDNPERMAKCLEIAKSRVDIIITTGGLGPTCDDLTKQLLAKSFGLELKMDEDEKAGLYDYLTNKGYSREMTENNLQQALLPEGCTKFHNNWGTAPGCAFEKDGKICVMSSTLEPLRTQPSKTRMKTMTPL